MINNVALLIINKYANQYMPIYRLACKNTASSGFASFDIKHANFWIWSKSKLLHKHCGNLKTISNHHVCMVTFITGLTSIIINMLYKISMPVTLSINKWWGLQINGWPRPLNLRLSYSYHIWSFEEIAL